MDIDLHHNRWLLAAGAPKDDEARDLLVPLGFADWRTAADHLARLARAPLAQPGMASALPHLFAALAVCASPDRAVLNLQRWVETQRDAGQAWQQLGADRRALELLVTLFAGSQFLSEILLSTPAHFSLLADRASLSRRKSIADFLSQAGECAAPYLAGVYGCAAADAVLSCLRMQRCELLRIGLGDLSGLLDLSSVTLQLSFLAESIVRACLAVAARQEGVAPDGFAVLALGKLGGGELNYSSDIDLIFLAREQSGRYQRLAQTLIQLLTGATSEGFLYRVDMRLRPWGRVGPLVTTLSGHLAYLRQHARLWEKQSLLRARLLAGDEGLANAFLTAAAPYVFAVDRETARRDVHAMKQLTEAWLRQTGHAWGEVKLGEGSIRDIEFVVQYLQLVHGAEQPALRTGNTGQGLARLARAGFLSATDVRVLADGYLFLRTLEHHLQILESQQTHSLPGNAVSLRYLARRLGFTDTSSALSELQQGGRPASLAAIDSAARLITVYRQHSAAVRAVYHRYLAPLTGPERPSLSPGVSGDLAMTLPAESPTRSAGDSEAPLSDAIAPDYLAERARQHLARMSPDYAASFNPDEIRRHVDLVACLSSANLVEVRADDLDGQCWQVTIVAYDYLGELSLICGLLFAYGFSIIEGQVHTYEPHAVLPAQHPATASPRATAQDGSPAAKAPAADTRRKIVDVFTVRLAFPARAGDMQTLWSRYVADLAALLKLLDARQQREAQGELAKRVAVALPQAPGSVPVLHPIDIQIDNEVSEHYTVLRIDTPDTVGFLYEFSNALALNGVHIAQVAVSSRGNRVHDVLYVTDAQGRKLTGPDRERELRAATVLVKHFTHLLPHSPNPETALRHFNEYLGELFRRPGWPDELASLEQPDVLAALARLLGVSDFLWDDFLRMQYANLFPVVRDVEGLAQEKSRTQLSTELAASLALASSTEERLHKLNVFKDREMFRIDMRHILGRITDFAQFSAELTSLVEVVVATACQVCEADLRVQYGLPVDERGQPIPLSLCVLGKCGGYELGYASDIEVMFIYGSSGQTTGRRSISAAEYFDKLVVAFVRAIEARHEGIFEIDLDLRPYGKAGSLAVSLDAFRRYFALGGPAWAYERQALVKLRAVAGDTQLGQQVELLRDGYVYSGAPFDVAAMRAMRERQLRHLVTPGTFNAKYSLGGLADVEYVVQGLQMSYGHACPSLRLTNTRAAIGALARHGFIAQQDGSDLTQAHLFLQVLINALRVVRGHSRDLTIPPESSEEFAFLARRLGYQNQPERLQSELAEHTGRVVRLGTGLLQTLSRQDDKQYPFGS